MHTRVIAKTLIFDDTGQVLVLRRSPDDSHRPGGYDFPGGSVHTGEIFEVGAVREIREETGFDCKTEDLQLVFTTCKMGRRSEDNVRINLIWMGFVTKMPVDQAVTLSEEHDKYAWLTLDEFLIATDHPAQHTLINYIRNNKIAEDLWNTN